MKTRSLILLGLYGTLLAIAVATGFIAFRDMQEQTRGVTYGALHDSTNAFQAPVGVNAALEQYADADLPRALDLVQRGGFPLVRQHFPWSDIEPRQGDFQWAKWDQIVIQAAERGMDLIAVLDTTPVWARDPGERDLATAPPVQVDDYARFVAAFVRRYGARVHYVQLWDNPNVHPFWGRHIVDPFEYTALLRAGAIAARGANPTIRILSAGLSPNTELIRGHSDYSDVLFLRGMYEAGARDYFDILGAKAFGMWTGPEDRRVAIDVFNFSRVILLHDEMVSHGDGAKQVWAVEFGWNALPQNWEGAASPWGTDTEAVQSRRIVAAVQRARSEWPWMKALIGQTLEPNAPANDPVWGFTLVTQGGQTRSLYSALVEARSAPAEPASFDFSRVYGALMGLALVALVAFWRGTMTAARLPWATGWQAIETRFAALPEWVQFGLVALSVAAFYFSRNTLLNFLLLALVALFFMLRLDLGLVITVFTIPFYLLAKNLVGSMQFSLVEILTLTAVFAWGMRQVKSKKHVLSEAEGLKAKSETGVASSTVSHRGQRLALSWSQDKRLQITVGTLSFSLLTFDLAFILFVLAGLLSVKVAGNFGVANREFRVIVLEPVLFYFLIRASGLTRRDLTRLVDAFLLSALAISAIGLYQYFFTNYVIIGEGVRRILAVYGSPNNLALYLDRALPLLLALVLFVQDKRRRVVYAVIALPMVLCWYLTYSRAAWIGVAAGLLFIGLFSGRRVRLGMAALVVIGLIVLIPFVGTARFQSLFQQGSGTGFFRLSVMQSGVAMIRDHPLFGVGLDNFLYEYPKYMLPDAWREPNLSHPHNIILDFWVRMGMLGVIVLGWSVFEFYKRGLEQLKLDRALMLGLMASVTAALVHGMMDAAYFYVDLAFVFMLIFGVVVEAGRQGDSGTRRQGEGVIR